ncbi:MAG: hypothetical protein ACLFWR_08310 [Acidimicrobiales bacterium]
MALALGAAGTGAAMFVVSRPWVGVVAALGTVAVGWWPRLGHVAAVAAPGFLLASYPLGRPMVAWAALGVVVAVAVAWELRTGGRGVRDRSPR